MRNITIEAPRRSGKTRQCRKRAERLLAKGETVLLIVPLHWDEHSCNTRLKSTKTLTCISTEEIDTYTKFGADHLILDELPHISFDSFTHIRKSKFKIYTDRNNERF